MKFEKSKLIKVEIYGQNVEMKNPTFGQVKELAKITADSKDNSVEAMNAFLLELGLSQQILNDMETDHVVKLCEYLTSKKN